MLQALENWNHFDPYFFYVLENLDESEAKRNIEHLKQLREIRDSKLKKQREQRERSQKELNNKKNTLEELHNQFLNLYQGNDDSGKSISSQQRGYLFKNFIKGLAIYEALSVSDPIKLVEEQIDGTIKYEGKNYIVKAKWQDSLTASSSLYHFAHKVEGKFYGRGIFISINGFSEDSVSALVNGKAINTILVEGADLVLAVEKQYSFKEIFDRKIKAAQTMGKIYIDVTKMKNKFG